MRRKKLYNYLINVRKNFKYGFRDVEGSILDVSKFERNQVGSDNDSVKKSLGENNMRKNILDNLDHDLLREEIDLLHDQSREKRLCIK